SDHDDVLAVSPFKHDSLGNITGFQQTSINGGGGSDKLFGSVGTSISAFDGHDVIGQLGFSSSDAQAMLGFISGQLAGSLGFVGAGASSGSLGFTSATSAAASLGF